MRTETIACDLCGCEDFTIVWDKIEREKKKLLASAVIRDDEGVIINGVTAMCDKCGLVCINPRMDEVETKSFYAEKYRDTYEVDDFGEKYHANKALEFLGRQGFVKPSFKTLDIGSASGYLVSALQDMGCDSYGCEQNNVTAEIAIKRNLRVFNNRIEDLEEGNFDLITILNTLEHMHSPRKVLSKIRDLMSSEGRLFIIVPNLYNHTANITGDAFMSNAHLFHFDIDTLEQYMNLCGFDIVTMKVVPEMNMDKIYLIAKKGTEKPIKVDYLVDSAQITNRISAMEYLYMTSWIKMNGGGKY